MSPKTAFLLSLLFIKHFWADYVLQDGKMAKDKATKPKVLFLHSFHHAILTFAIIFALGYEIVAGFIVFVIEFFLHALLDHLKSNNIFYKKAEYPQQRFFINLVLDQLLHALTYIAIAYFLSV